MENPKDKSEKRSLRERWRDPFGKERNIGNRLPVKEDGRVTIAFNLHTYYMLLALARRLECSKSEALRRLLSFMVGPIMRAIKDEQPSVEIPGFKLPLLRQDWAEHERSSARGRVDLG